MKLIKLMYGWVVILFHKSWSSLEEFNSILTSNFLKYSDIFQYHALSCKSLLTLPYRCYFNVFSPLFFTDIGQIFSPGTNFKTVARRLFGWKPEIEHGGKRNYMFKRKIIHHPQVNQNNS